MIDRAFAFGCFIAALYLTSIQIGDDQYLSAALIALALGAVGLGHILQKQWAAQASAFLLIGVNLYAIFHYFPPFGGASLVGEDLPRIAKLGLISLLCIGGCVILYFVQRSAAKTSV